MRIIKYSLLFLFLWLFIPINTLADTGHSTIIMDADSGRILYENNVYQKRLIASITKIMTCIITIENSSLDKMVEVEDSVLKMYGTSIYVQVGEKISIEDLLYGLMLRSGNDAAVVLSNNVFENEEIFIKAMNNKAKEIGMKNTIFENPHGLDEDDTKNYSTAYDMAVLARYAFQNSIYRKIISTKKYTTKTNFKSYVWHNRMSLINSYKKCIGGKNGYTPAAGKTLVSYAKDNGLSLIIVSLDDSDNYENHKSLYEKFFKLYNNYLIIDKNNFYIDSSLIDSKAYIKDSFVYPLKDNEIKKVSTIIKLNNSKNKNNIIGKITVKLGDTEIGNVDIYSKNKKEDKTSIFDRIKKLFIR